MSRATQILVVASAFFLLSVSTHAQKESKSTVWVDQLSEGAADLQAAVLKKHTPVTFTTDRESANQVAALTVTDRRGSTAKAIFIGPAFSGAERTMTLVVSDAKTNTVVFSYTCERKGEGASFQSTAECLAKHWSNFVEKGRP